MLVLNEILKINMLSNFSNKVRNPISLWISTLPLQNLEKYLLSGSLIFFLHLNW